MGIQKAKGGLGGTCESIAAANMYSHDDLTKSELKDIRLKKKKKNSVELLNMEKFPIVWVFLNILKNLKLHCSYYEVTSQSNTVKCLCQNTLAGAKEWNSYFACSGTGVVYKENCMRNVSKLFSFAAVVSCH